MPDLEKTRSELLAEIAQLRRRLAGEDATGSANGPGDAPTARSSYAERLLDALPEAVSVTDLDGRICYVNHAFLRNMDLGEDCIVGKTFPEIGVVEATQFYAVHEQVMPQLLAQGTVREVETLGLNPDGSRFAVLVDLSLLRDAAGEPSHVAALVRQVKDLRETEYALMHSEQKYRDIVDTVADLILAFDRDGTVLSVNSAAKTMLGLDPNEVIGRCGTDLVFDEHRASVEAQIERVLRGQSVQAETVLVGRENRLVHVEYRCSPLVEDGRVVGGRVIAWDITRRKRLECELKASEERYRTLVESAGETIAAVDESGTFLFLNSTAAGRLGGRPADFVGKTMWDLFPAEIADRQAASIRQVIRTGEGSNAVSLTFVGGEMRWYNTTIQPLRDSGNKATAALIIARDIHEFKKTKDELDAYREQMIRAEQLASLGTLSATLSHELTQPLTVIRLSIQNALEDLESGSCPPRVVEDLKDGLAEVASVTAIAERFRGFARRSSGKVVETISIHETVGKVMRLLRESAQQACIVLETQGLEALPPVPMHEKGLEQLVFAITQNAIQAADGQRRRRFTIAGHSDGHWIELLFSDDCGGIAPENLGRVFEPFFSTKPMGQGTGLGLCIVQQIVSRTRGQIHVESDFGRGTTFRVSLPVEEM
ncbi:PAS domain S-box protein [Anaerobaca lacustris]|uniref:histidine kinase n=1 Tax=Anaerobaca lacustris TaxID=3044600 RepID=A0AAW6TZW0_9BACT|nr:PAS domain S-box protein [Sedimentisphaerales bacterium M17dextr]